MILQYEFLFQVVSIHHCFSYNSNNQCCLIQWNFSHVHHYSDGNVSSIKNVKKSLEYRTCCYLSFQFVSYVEVTLYGWSLTEVDAQTRHRSEVVDTANKVSCANS